MGAVVQDQSSAFDTNLSTSWAISFGSNITAGNLIYCWGGSISNVGSASPTDTRAHTYTLIRSTYDATADFTHTTWYAKNTSAGANTTTLDATYQNNFCRMGVLEISGLNTTTPLDGAIEVGAVDATTNGTDTASAGTLVTTNASDFLVGSAQNVVQGEVGTLTFTAGTSWTGRTPTGGPHVGKMQTRVVSSTGSYTAAFSGDVDQRSIIHGVAFQDAAGEATQAQIWPSIQQGILNPMIGRRYV